jgi:hypothetical protein
MEPVIAQKWIFVKLLADGMDTIRRSRRQVGLGDTGY